MGGNMGGKVVKKQAFTEIRAPETPGGDEEEEGDIFQFIRRRASDGKEDGDGEVEGEMGGVV